MTEELKPAPLPEEVCKAMLQPGEWVDWTLQNVGVVVERLAIVSGHITAQAAEIDRLLGELNHEQAIAEAHRDEISELKESLKDTEIACDSLEALNQHLDSITIAQAAADFVYAHSPPHGDVGISKLAYDLAKRILRDAAITNQVIIQLREVRESLSEATVARSKAEGRLRIHQALHNSMMTMSWWERLKFVLLNQSPKEGG